MPSGQHRVTFVSLGSLGRFAFLAVDPDPGLMKEVENCRLTNCGA
jgi:hypothetical protein